MLALETLVNCSVLSHTTLHSPCYRIPCGAATSGACAQLTKKVRELTNTDGTYWFSSNVNGPSCHWGFYLRFCQNHSFDCCAMLT